MGDYEHVAAGGAEEEHFDGLLLWVGSGRGCLQILGVVCSCVLVK